ncbi:thiol-disulfide oxidoreductase DCC family protein [Ancylomarina longa]|uniref:Thiol-disulfide oxidoreductase DCC family protein n=1 Tax=Ancylomarina longa TaxID=2487017 RepID=A0A434AVT6_9BACT|nr:thiol-disulfide oxidoreductase DCC family protein [Ancylomarina longa]RUT78602.1 thiol-disulfide oxidoreductase DCC family protein [Ancylomarina longa]
MQEFTSHNNITKPVVLFDGLCNLCSTAVQFILTYNKKQNLFFASLQSDFAQELLTQYKVESRMDTVIFIEDQQVYQKSAAAFQISKHLVYPWKAFYYFRYIPKFLSDWIYLRIANNRYSWFGKKSVCMVPQPEWKHRFLE